MKRLAVIIALTALTTFVTGCAAVKVVAHAATAAAEMSGAISADTADSLHRVSDKAVEAFEKFTPENEYYIGRTIAANVLGKYPAYDNPGINAYLNELGQSLAMASDKPETFNGYHFLVLDTDEVNAFAAPGGLIFVTRGLLRCCKNEDSVAAILAHEIGHVQLDHGMGAISKSRKTELIKVVGVEIAKHYAGEELEALVGVFENTIGDIVQTMVVSGYKQDQEFEADAAAVEIMTRVGYNPRALTDMLRVMEAHLGDSKKGFGSTHPTPAERISKASVLVKAAGKVQAPNARQIRFSRALAGV